MMASDIRLALDASGIGARVGLTLDPWQAEVLRDRPHRGLLCCSRQSGKSTVTALLALWTAVYDPGLIVIVSPSLRQSQEMFRSIMLFRAAMSPEPKLKSESALRAEFKNGSRILALPGSQKTVRGLAAVKLGIIDEAAQVEDDLIAAVRPMLATVNGSLLALSTPFGRRGFFFDAWQSEDQGWTKVRVPASECPRLTKDFLDAELKALGPIAFSEEYGLEFRESALQVFSSFVIDRAFADMEVRPLW